MPRGLQFLLLLLAVPLQYLICEWTSPSEGERAQLVKQYVFTLILKLVERAKCKNKFVGHEVPINVLGCKLAMHNSTMLMTRKAGLP